MIKKKRKKKLVIVCLYRAHQRWAPEIQNAADFVSGLGDRGNYGISSCACAVSFRETGGKGMGTMLTLHVLWTLQSSSDLTLTVSQQSGIDSTLQMRKRRLSKM